MKKFVSILLSLALLCILNLSALAADNPAFSISLGGTVDTNTQFNGQSTFVVTWQIKANRPGLALTNTQGIRLAYDNNVLQLIRWNASSSFSESVAGEDFVLIQDTGVGKIGVLGSSITVFTAKSGDGAIGYLSVSVGNNKDYSACPQNTNITLGGFRFAFRSGKGVSDLTGNSIRIMRTSELFALSQSYSVLISDDQDNAHTYGNHANGVAQPNKDTLGAPAISVIAMNLNGSVLSYNPKVPTIIKLMQNNIEMRKTEIAAANGLGQVKQDFVFDNVVPGMYSIVITKNMHMMLTVNNVAVGEGGIDLTQDSRDAIKCLTLLCGDINGDGEINQADLNVLWQPSNYNKRVSEGADSRCDLNGDGEVNQLDLNILWQLVNYNKGPVAVDAKENGFI